MLATSPCTAATHAALKSDRTAFLAATTPAGYLDDGVERLALRTCRACGSTLAIPAEAGAAEAA